MRITTKGKDEAMSRDERAHVSACEPHNSPLLSAQFVFSLFLFVWQHFLCGFTYAQKEELQLLNYHPKCIPRGIHLIHNRIGCQTL